jgi:hypothetical protein
VTGSLPRRLLGALLLFFSFAPIYLILDTEDDGLRRAIVDAAGSTLGLILTGTLTATLLGVLLAFILPRHRIVPALDRLGAAVESVPPWRWSLGTGLTAFILAAGANVLLFRGLYTHVDEISSFIHARYLAAGLLAGPLPASAEGWLLPNMLTVDAGWVSQFPPSHLLALAAGATAGAPMVIGPFFFALMAVAVALSLPRLLSDHGRVARLAGPLMVLSTFLLLLGSGGWSHTTAGAFLWVAMYAALRARDGHPAWAIGAGVAIGLAVSSRPWIGIILGTVATLGVWLPAQRNVRWLATRSAGTVLGGLPFAISLGAYNKALFGGPATLGYLAAFGDRHRLGFHPDPWGNPYTPVEAIALTSGDLIVFGAQLLETPVPLGLAIGAWLVLSRRLPRGSPLLVGWALIPVAGNAIYWFHGTRMMYEAAPAWLALTLLAVAPFFHTGEEPSDTSLDELHGSVERAGGTGALRRSRLDVMGIGMWTTLVSAGMALLLGAPQRLSSFAWDDETMSRVTVPEPPDGRPALVFVHAAWHERLSARLQGAGGMRQDSVISLLRRNTHCQLEEYARARAALDGDDTVALPDIDLRQLPGTPPDIVYPQAPDGTVLRTRDGERFTPSCRRELGADRFGVVSLAPLLWQGDLPGIEEGDPLFVRDLGPEWNRTLVEHYSERTPWVFVPTSPDAPPELVPYADAMQVLWGAGPPVGAVQDPVGRP